MRIFKYCLTQPSTKYRVTENAFAFATTFPQIVSDLDLSSKHYVAYVQGRTPADFSSFLRKHEVTHVLLTGITANFSNCIDLALEAKSVGCITVIGGIFPSLNSQIIAQNYLCFDYVVAGRPDTSLKLATANTPSSPKQLFFSHPPNTNSSFIKAWQSEHFVHAYSADLICYELSFGCAHNCSFCSMRKAWGAHTPKTKDIEIAKADLDYASQIWNKLKIIDDDLFANIDCFLELNTISKFKIVIANARAENITRRNTKLAQEMGITHLTFGVESFNLDSLRAINKGAQSDWNYQVKLAIENCLACNITPRPIVMIGAPGSTLSDIKRLKSKLKTWNTSAGIELFLSFFTPHPGLTMISKDDNLYCTDLNFFDHLHPVYLPATYSHNDLFEVIETYNDIVALTGSERYNPIIDCEYDCNSQFDFLFPPSSGTTL